MAKLRSSAADLARFLTGQIVPPTQSSYGKLRRVNNRAINKYPAMIVRCITESDVQLAIKFARENRLLVAVRSGGHSFAGYGVCNQGLVIDLSLMKRVEINPERRRVHIQPGITGGELDCVTQAFKMAVPLGSCPTVGVAGYCLGGGESSLTPKFGYACDNLRALEVVTADGQTLTATMDENSDLFWAMRGAGANFGVATRLEFNLNQVDSVLSGSLRYPVRNTRKMLRFLDDFVRTIPSECSLTAAVLPHPGERMLDIKIVWLGSEKTGLGILRPLRTHIRPFENSIRSKPYLDEQRAGYDVPGGTLSRFRRGGHFSHLTDEIIERIVEHAWAAPHEASGITMIYWHGPWCSKPHDDAFGFRRTGFEYWIHSYWKKAHDAKKSRHWVETFFNALKPLSTGSVYVNSLEDEGNERVRAAYADKYPRLEQLKRRFDPDNVFRVNQNIPPANRAYE